MTERSAGQRGPGRERRPALERRPAAPGRPALEIHRSERRRRSAQAYARDGQVVLRLPAGIPAAEEERLIDQLVRKVDGRTRADALGGDQALEDRAAALADRYLDGVRPTSVRWSGRMERRHGSCTPATGEIRISRDLALHPAYVLDYVLVHELAHLEFPGHPPAFHELVARYPHAERARGYLDGYAAGRLASGIPDVDDAPAVGSDDPQPPLPLSG